MRKQKRVRISQCMIVKDEEKNIEQALSWGRDIMWEQIVVDTGSSDRTVELAEAMGAKVFHFPWIDDFAAAKNFALEQAKGDWIAFLDADEYIPREMVGKVGPILSDLQGSPYVALLCDLMNMNNEGKLFFGITQIRLFKNMQEIRYEGRIHEGLTIRGRKFQPAEVLAASEEFIIIHTGYSHSVMDEKNKGTRNRRILLRELEERPGDSALMGYLADTYFVDGDYGKAVEWFEKAANLIPETPVPFFARDSHTFGSLMSLLSTKDTESRMMEVYEKGIKRLPQDADLDYVAGNYFAKTGNYEKGIYHLERAINILEKYGNNFRATRMSPNVGEAWEMLAMCYYESGQLEQCVSCCTGLLKAQPYIINTLMILLKAFDADRKRYEKELQEALQAEPHTESPRQAATARQVLAFLGGIYDLGSKKDRVFLLKAAMESGYEDMVKEVRATFTGEELEALNQAMEKKWAVKGQ